MLKVTVEFGGKVLNTYTTDKDEFFIGRNKENDIQIDNLAVSGRHARIIKDHDSIEVEDLNSTNGTFVDSHKVSRKNVESTNRITIGKHNLFIHPDAFSAGVPDFIETVKVNMKNP